MPNFEIIKLRDARNMGTYNNVMLSLAKRFVLEEGTATQIAMQRHLNRYTKEVNAYMLAFIRETGFNPDTFIDARKYSARGTLFNEKAISKVYHLSSVLAGGDWGDITRENDAATNAGCVHYLWHAYKENPKAFIRNYDVRLELGNFMRNSDQGQRNDWNSESTQASSSMRALLSLGIVTEGKGDTWKIARPDMLEYLYASVVEALGDDWEGDDVPDYNKEIEFPAISYPGKMPADLVERACKLCDIPYSKELEMTQQEAPETAKEAPAEPPAPKETPEEAKARIAAEKLAAKEAAKAEKLAAKEAAKAAKLAAAPAAVKLTGMTNKEAETLAKIADGGLSEEEAQKLAAELGAAPDSVKEAPEGVSDDNPDNAGAVTSVRDDVPAE